MALTDFQTRSLKAKLKRRHVKTKENFGSPVSYIEGWHAISEANRIFGFDSWDRQTLTPRCHWTQLRSGETVCFYSTKVRVTVRAGETVTVREGMGTGFGRSSQPEFAHEFALKAAETDATKRALATFGNPFGLALYDRDQTQVTKARTKAVDARASMRAIATAGAAAEATPPGRTGRALADFALVDAEGRIRQFKHHSDFVKEAVRQIEGLDTVEAVYAFWSCNAANFGKLTTVSENGEPTVRRLAEALKERARQVGLQHEREHSQASNNQAELASAKHEPEKEEIESANGAFLIPKEKRIRDTAHLAFVASQPCLICGRRPTQAHHIRFAQPQAMALKVSDEFTVPLCNAHHDQLHRSGSERGFWAKNRIPDPLKFAARLWDASRDQRKRALVGGSATIDPDLEPEFNEPVLKRKSDAPSSQT